MSGICTQAGMMRARPAAGGGATLAFTDSGAGTTATTLTLSARSLGAAATDREILVAVMHRNTGNYEPPAVTVSGISASLVVGLKNAGIVAISAQIWRAAVPTGTTGDVVVTIASGGVWTNVAVYRATGLAAGAADTGTGNTNATNSTTLTAASGAVALGCSGGATTGGPTATWTNLTEDYDVNTSASSDTATAASAQSLSGTTTVTAAITGTITAFAAASFDPL